MAQEVILTLEDALLLVVNTAGRARRGNVVESVSLLDSVGRVLAADLRADRDQPAFDRATRDGFAIRAGRVGRRAAAGSRRGARRQRLDGQFATRSGRKHHDRGTGAGGRRLRGDGGAYR